jgi:hypothetical protein
MGKNSTTTKTDNSPWGPVQQPLIGTFNRAGSLAQAGVGPQVFPGTTVAPMSVPTQAGLMGATREAATGYNLGGDLTNQLRGFINSGGMNMDMRRASHELGRGFRGGHDVGGQGMFSLADSLGRPSPYGTNLRSIARGNNIHNYNKDYLSDYANGNNGLANPYMSKALDYQLENAANMVNSRFSNAGRYGSGAHTRALMKEMGGIRANTLYNQFNQDANRQLRASGMIQAGQDSRINSMLRGAQIGSNVDLARTGQRMQALGQGYGIQAADANRRLKAAADVGQLGDTSINNIMQASGAAPTVNDLRYSDYNKLLSVGANVQNYQQRLIDESVNKFNQQNQLPWDYLGLEQGVYQPATMRFGNQTTKSSKSFNPMSLVGVPMMAMGGGK